VQRTGEVVQDGLAAWHAKADGNCAVDYGFHMILGGIDDDSLKAMDYLVDNEGITSFKLFMAYPGVFYSDDGKILRAMQRASDNGAVIMMHAENGIAIDVLVQQALARGETDPKYHGITRPSALEGEATNRAIVLAGVAGNCPLYIVHMSRRRPWKRWPKRATRPQRLCRDVPAVPLPDARGDARQARLRRGQWVCSPPIRTGHAHHQSDLWKGLRTNELICVSTDHCPFCFKEQKELGLGDFTKIPNGIGGVEHRMDLIYQGVVNGELSLTRWVETCATTPARMFGLYPKKGVIAPGSDADIVIYDPKGRTEIGFGKSHHMNMDHSAWEGTVIDGKVETVLSRGTVVIEGDEYVGRKGHGQFLKRGLCQYLT
jgi:dihydropyrimidinase